MATSRASTPSPGGNPGVFVTTPLASSTQDVISTHEINFPDDLNAVDVSDISSLKEEYEVINKNLDFLLNYNCSGRQLRPRAGETIQDKKTDKKKDKKHKVPDTVNEKFKSISNVNDLHGGVLLDYLLKVNSLNKKLLSNYEKLNDKYINLSNKFDQLNIVTSDSKNLPDQQLNSSHCLQNNHASKNVATDKPDVDKDAIELKIDSIEQRANEQFILCSGTVISDALNIERGFPNLNKTKFVDIIQSLVPSLSGDDFHRINLIGKNKNVVKVECTSINVKNKLSYEARKRKLKDLFVSEYLTSYRNNIFYRLREIKRKYSDKVAAVYVRSGTIFYKLSSGTNHRSVLRLTDVTELETRLSDN